MEKCSRCNQYVKNKDIKWIDKKMYCNHCYSVVKYINKEKREREEREKLKKIKNGK